MYNKKQYKTIVGKRQFSRRVAKERQELFQMCSMDSSNVEVTADNNFDLDTNFLNADKSSELLDPNSSSNLSDEHDLNIELFNEQIEFNTVINEYCETNVSKSVDVEDNKQLDLQSQLRKWAVCSKVSHSSLNGLLKILVPLYPGLPLDSRTLLKTPVSTSVKQLENGEYCHIGIAKGLKSLLPFSCKDEVIKISVNVDGIPLYTSSKLQFWPITAIIRNFNSPPFAIGIFCGNSKPSPLSDFLEDFIQEFAFLKENGILIHDHTYSIEIENFICDAPAKAYLKCIKSHNGYLSCDKCWETGEYHHRNGKVILKGINALRRTDEQFLREMDEDHHLGKTPLLDLSIGLVSCFTIDYMHAVCLGVMKRLFTTWISGNLSDRLKNADVQILSKRLISLRSFIPCEFNRKSRALDEIAYCGKLQNIELFLYI
uniref:Uncharacterized protein LOC114346767 n=1 Tax=Diabrotica virgifera virgifera TaxID=50390 RepID=A0A6P7HC19_DIAVI